MTTDVFTEFGEAVKALVHAKSETKSMVESASQDKNPGVADVADAVLSKKPENAITTYFKDKLELALQTSERQLAMNMTAKINNESEAEAEDTVRPG